MRFKEDRPRSNQQVMRSCDASHVDECNATRRDTAGAPEQSQLPRSCKRAPDYSYPAMLKGCYIFALLACIPTTRPYRAGPFCLRCARPETFPRGVTLHLTCPSTEALQAEAPRDNHKKYGKRLDSEVSFPRSFCQLPSASTSRPFALGS